MYVSKTNKHQHDTIKPFIASIPNLLLTSMNREFISVATTESFIVACQKIDGPHNFRHLNEHHDEILYVISGELDVWTSVGMETLKAGNLIKIPKFLEHGDLKGRNCEILILTGGL